MTKYRITDIGYSEFISNRTKYRAPTVTAKLMHILSSRVGYTLDSLASQVAQDTRVDSSGGSAAIREINNLVTLGYVEVLIV
jgi:hypothetical protein